MVPPAAKGYMAGIVGRSLSESFSLSTKYTSTEDRVLEPASGGFSFGSHALLSHCRTSNKPYYGTFFLTVYYLYACFGAKIKTKKFF
jgi:hypothetical protein